MEARLGLSSGAGYMLLGDGSTTGGTRLLGATPRPDCAAASTEAAAL